MDILNIKRLNYTTNSITFHVIFHGGAYSGQRRNRLVKILDTCAQYILLPNQVAIHMDSPRILITGNQHARCLGCALPDGKTIHIAKLKLSEMGSVISHELGHIEHLNLYPDSAHENEWTELNRENYANTLGEYYDYAQSSSEPYAFTISQYIRIDKTGGIIRANVASLTVAI